MSTALDNLLSKLSAKQIQAIASVGQQKVSIWHGAVSSGKTFASLLAFLIAVPKAPRSGLIVICGRSLKTIEMNILNPLMDPARFGVFAEHVKHTTGSTEAVILGRIVHLIGANDVRAEGRIRGSTIGLVAADEASLLPKSFWMMLLSRLRVPGEQNILLATTNPDSQAHWLRKDFILHGAKKGVLDWSFLIDDNPALDDEYKETLKSQYTGLWYKRFIEGKWVASEGVVYDMWDEDRYVIAPEDVPPIIDWVGVGVDYGTSNPFSALLLGVGMGSDNVKRLHFVSEWRYDGRASRRQMTDIEYAQALVDWLRAPTVRHRDVQVPWVCIDPSAASFKVQCRASGLRVVDADNAVVDGIRMVSSLLRADRLRVSRDCPGLISEIGAYCWDERASLLGRDEPMKVDDHSCDSGRYVCFTTRGAWRKHIPLQVALSKAA